MDLTWLAIDWLETYCSVFRYHPLHIGTGRRDDRTGLKEIKYAGVTYAFAVSVGFWLTA